MTDLLNRRHEVQRALLDMIAQLTSIPFGLYELRDGEMEGIIPETARSNFAHHCNYIYNLPEGRKLCEADHCDRAALALKSQCEEPTICHAGMYNQTTPIKIGGETRAVLLYGQMQIEGAEHRRKALEKHREAVAKLNLDRDQAARVKQLLLSSKTYTPQQLKVLKRLLSKAEEWLYAMIDEEDRAKDIVERTTHEINTRLQAVIANAENLATEIDYLSPEEAAMMARSVLDSAKAFDTVVQTLGEHLEDYNFRSQTLGGLIQEAKDLYEGEATRRGIEIRMELQRAYDRNASVYVSRRHLQFAINNLLHNSVKYSFRGNANRRRHVTISGQPDGNYYRLSFTNFGVGILLEEITSNSVFKDGYQGKLTKDEYRSGSGKGLYFVKRIIDRHKGRIDVESRLKSDEETPEGRPHLNRFTIYLPFAPSTGS